MTLLLIATASLVTIVLRALPFVLFGNSHMPPVLHKIADLMPPAIIAVLVVYCLKGSVVNLSLESAAAAAAAAATALVHVWKRNTLASIGLGTVVYMVLIRIMV